MSAGVALVFGGSRGINDEMRAMIRPLLAIGRLGEDTEVASLVAYLARPESSFVTGSAITIDGGYLA
jgi:3-oxoacyl-[acyl-carrier protein] reductase